MSLEVNTDRNNNVMLHGYRMIIVLKCHCPPQLVNLMQQVTRALLLKKHQLKILM